ncbi:hypothetical protein CAEBREN_24687 [Caenorhabditis brenneri]|uniref:BTB domain-containing protein n=1 Tax=Caenorhabditis brenneri TaxID=135651 RepID=G0MUX8_CAEBE|nr:hypothetical protein CAEBREN_24687 [Caenorhabditis brenneri]
MSAEPPRKRGREGPPEVVPAEENPDNVIIKVEEMQFLFTKTYLAEHSGYFERMFFSSFAERDKKEVTMKGVKKEDFALFLKIIDGTGVITDDSVRPMLRLTQYLEARGAEQKCAEFLMGPSGKTVKEKFELGNRFRLEPLIAQILSNINTTEELKTIAPLTDIPSLSNIAQTHVLQKCYALLEIPVDYVYQDMLNQALDNVEEEERRRREAEQLIHQGVADWHRQVDHIRGFVHPRNLRYYLQMQQQDQLYRAIGFLEAISEAQRAQVVGQAQYWIGQNGVNPMEEFVPLDYRFQYQNMAAPAPNQAQPAPPNRAPRHPVQAPAPIDLVVEAPNLVGLQQAQRVYANVLDQIPNPFQRLIAAQALAQSQNVHAPINRGIDDPSPWRAFLERHLAQNPLGQNQAPQVNQVAAQAPNQAQQPGQPALPNPDGMDGLMPWEARHNEEAVRQHAPRVAGYVVALHGQHQNQQNPAQPQLRLALVAAQAPNQVRQPGQAAPRNRDPNGMMGLLREAPRPNLVDQDNREAALQLAQRVLAERIAAICDPFQNQQDLAQVQHRLAQVAAQIAQGGVEAPRPNPVDPAPGMNPLNQRLMNSAPWSLERFEAAIEVFPQHLQPGIRQILFSLFPQNRGDQEPIVEEPNPPGQ